MHVVNISGISESRVAKVVAELIEEKDQSIIIVSTDVRAKRLSSDLSFFAKDKQIEVITTKEQFNHQFDARSHEDASDSLIALKKLALGESVTVIVSSLVATNRLIPHDRFINSKIKLSYGEEINLEELKNKLVDLGYERTDRVESKGQFSVRGGIIDVFLPDQENPTRIELFDVEIDSIRMFDKDSQRSIENIKEIEIFPANELLEKCLEYDEYKSEYIWNYLEDGKVIIDDPDRIYEVLESEDERTEAFKLSLKSNDLTLITPFSKRIAGIERYDEIRTINSRQSLIYNGKLNIFETDLHAFIKKGYKIHLVFQSKERLENIREFLNRCKLDSKVNFEVGTLTSGIEYPDDKEIWISESDIFTTQKKAKRKKKIDNGQKIQSFSDMREGDFVVHENHGIGKFIGIVQLSIEGEKQDYIKIKYAGEDMLYVPVEQMDIVQKYIGGDSSQPRMNKLSGSEWKATKAKAKAAIAVMAQDLIELYAKRKMTPGFSFSKDTVWQGEFEAAFPYEETDDQLRSIEEIKADMEKPFSMDRLLLGDVGYGKTEVAARAIFKCLADSKQACVLVPTTILANQHYYTLKDRFEKFPFKVEVLSRFKNEKEQKEIVSKLEKGEVDLVIGTHRLLSSDIKFKDLGLLVIDEEQRFGVEDKENIKKLKNNVDVLTLSATPIPRTLNMSLNGIKDMSLIEEPPEERYPVQTYALEQEDNIIKDVIEKELSRGGQVYVVYNRVKGIQQVADKIKDLVPEARVIVGHGQMNEQALENVMLNFINGESDVLVATTIVESGLDIPNANTMIIMDSDRYGLSQLYQLRGRVGRTNRMAYCYLMYKKNQVLNELAEKRLRAICEFTEFGAGFKIAMRDLELRGAGNLLGTAQSGHLTSIGYELYCKMVDNAVRALKGEIVNDERGDISIEIPVSSYIPDSYIENESIKMEMYKKIAFVRSYNDEDDIVDELTDRFGDVPKSTINLIKIAHIRYLAEELSINRIHHVNEDSLPKKPVDPRFISNEKIKLVFDFNKENPLNAFALFNLNDRMGQKVFIHGGVSPYIRFSCLKNNMLDEVIEMLELLYDSKKSGK